VNLFQRVFNCAASTLQARHGQTQNSRVSHAHVFDIKEKLCEMDRILISL
jgi:hypothetical protein